MHLLKFNASIEWHSGSGAQLVQAVRSPRQTLTGAAAVVRRFLHSPHVGRCLARRARRWLACWLGYTRRH